MWLSLVGLVLAASFPGVLAGCAGGQATSSTSGGAAAKKHTLHDPVCKQNTKDGVQNADRLQVLSPCAAFQGKVVETPPRNPDGDVSFDVSPDRGFADMLNAKNRIEGSLHIEIVPRDQPGCTPGQPVVYRDVPSLGTCSGRNLRAPSLGAHVRIIGPWVLDRNNNWYEIHPVWKIEILRPQA